MGEYSGLVTSAPFASGSKSASDAIYLETGEGRFMLRRPEGNAFADPALQALVGKRIVATGELHDYLLLLDEWRETSDQKT